MAAPRESSNFLHYPPMTTTKSTRGAAALGLFFLSGFAALVYETVWTRRLVLVFGATLTSAATVLAGFMAGMALGAQRASSAIK